jgi:hypothetical protein
VLARKPEETTMRHILATALLATLTVVPSLAYAAMDASIIPDGTYVVKVEKIEDSKHALVLMQNGIETVLIAEGSVDFSKISTPSIKVSLIKGKVPVFAAAN